MLSTLSVNNIISESLSLHSRILLESIPSTDERLEKIISAMKEARLLHIVYKKYDSDQVKKPRWSKFMDTLNSKDDVESII